MLLNADFSRLAVVTPDRHDWVASPQAGVTRVMLDRVGGEVARATSIVRYVAGSRFPSHRHPGGEEILVLSGVFSDEAGDYPAGWYLRSPPGSSHAPSSAPGTTIFVKLLQMSGEERAPVRIDTRDRGNWTRDGGRGLCPLFSDGRERVVLLGQAHIVARVTHDRLVDLRWRMLPQRLVDAAAGHHVAGEHQHQRALRRHRRPRAASKCGLRARGA